MQSYLTNARDILIGLNEIHPNISMHPMLSAESGRISQMKTALGKLLFELLPGHKDGYLETLERVVASSRADAISSLAALDSVIKSRWSDSDDGLDDTSIVAENFIARLSDYRQNRRELEKLYQQRGIFNGN
jgi:hypothetical protein